MARVVSTFQFLEDYKKWSGAVEVLEHVDESQRDHIYIRMKVGNQQALKLPRTGLREIIEALEAADKEAASRFSAVVRKMNNRSEK